MKRMFAVFMVILLASVGFAQNFPIDEQELIKTIDYLSKQRFNHEYSSKEFNDIDKQKVDLESLKEEIDHAKEDSKNASSNIFKIRLQKGLVSRHCKAVAISDDLLLTYEGCFSQLKVDVFSIKGERNFESKMSDVTVVKGVGAFIKLNSKRTTGPYPRILINNDFKKSLEGTKFIYKGEERKVTEVCDKITCKIEGSFNFAILDTPGEPVFIKATDSSEYLVGFYSDEDYLASSLYRPIVKNLRANENTLRTELGEIFNKIYFSFSESI